jgi:uncharacterized protein YwqG
MRSSKTTIAQWLKNLFASETGCQRASSTDRESLANLPFELAWDAIKVSPVKRGAQGSRSHFGGAARLPAGRSWPSMGERPLDLLFTLDCEDLRGFTTSVELPTNGVLLFFYDLESQPWGGADDIGGWKVLYLVEGDAGAGDRPGTLPCCHAKFEQIKTWPDAWSPWVDALGLTADERFAVSEHYDPEQNWKAQIGGHPPVIQNAMEVDCELSSRGAALSPKVYETPAGKAAQARAREWRLLLHLPSDDDLGTVFADYGSLYFWIRADDLAAKDFSRVWIQLQTT